MLLVSSAALPNRGSSDWYNSRLAAESSMIASITRSAPAAPAPSRSDFSRDATSARLAWSLTRLANSSRARSMAGSR